MSHELIMLREIGRMQKLAKSLVKEVKYRAVKSHACANVKGGTLGQIEEICQLIQLRDDCLRFCFALKKAVQTLSQEERKLLTSYYIDKVNADTLAERFGVTKAQIYGKLYYARANLRSALNGLGCDEAWLTDNYSKFNFISERLAS